MFSGHISTLQLLNSCLNQRKLSISWGFFFCWENGPSHITLCGIIQSFYAITYIVVESTENLKLLKDIVTLFDVR